MKSANKLSTLRLTASNTSPLNSPPLDTLHFTDDVRAMPSLPPFHCFLRNEISFLMWVRTSETLADAASVNLVVADLPTVSFSSARATRASTASFTGKDLVYATYAAAAAPTTSVATTVREAV
jgi:hypothetical protein